MTVIACLFKNLTLLIDIRNARQTERERVKRKISFYFDWNLDTTFRAFDAIQVQRRLLVKRAELHCALLSLERKLFDKQRRREHLSSRRPPSPLLQLANAQAGWAPQKVVVVVAGAVEHNKIILLSVARLSLAAAVMVMAMASLASYFLWSSELTFSALALVRRSLALLPH